MWRRIVGGLLRSRRAADPPAGDGDAASVAVPAVTRREWASVPPLHRPLHQPVDAASGLARFSTALTDRHRGVRHVGPLGHEVHPSAPTGTVTGLARAVEPPRPARGPTLDKPLRSRGRPSTAGDAGPVIMRWPSAPSGDEGPDGGTAWVPAAPTGTGGAPIGHAVEPPPAAAETAAGRPEPEPDRPLVHEVRVLRAVATLGAAGPVPPAATSGVAQLPLPGRVRPPRPAGLPLRPLAVHGASIARAAEGSGPAAAQPSPAIAGGAAPAAEASTPVPAAGTPDVPVVAASLPPTPGPAGDVVPTSPGSVGTPPTVRPTLGADASTAPEVQRAADPAASALPARPERAGIGPPLASLPPTARRVADGPAARRGPAVTATGRDDAIVAALQRLRPGEPTPAPVAAPPSVLAAATFGPDLTAPPVVARRVAPIVDASPAGQLDALDGHDLSLPAPGIARALLPLASLRPPLVWDDDVADADPTGPTGASGGSPAADAFAGIPLVGTVEQARAARGSPAAIGAHRAAATPTSPPGATTPGSAAPLSAPAPLRRRSAGSLLRSTAAAHRAEGGGVPGPAAAVPVRWSSPGDPGTPAAPDTHPTVARDADLRGPAPGTSGGGEGGVMPPHVPPVRRLAARQIARPDTPAGDSDLGDVPAEHVDHPLVRQFLASRSAAAPDALPARPLPLAVQRTSEAPAAPPVAPVQRAEGDAAAATADVLAAPRPPEVEREELIRELYPRLRDELRWELRVQRERAGVLADPL